MALGSWQVASVIRFSGNGATYMASLARATALTNAQLQKNAGQISASQLAMQRYQARLQAIREAQLRFATVLSGLAFAGGVAFITEGISEAAKFERAMTGVQIATAATGQAFADLKTQVVAVSGVTAQSVVTIANEMFAASKGAFHNPKQLMSLFPMMAKYADVRFMAGGDDPVESIRLMTQYAHFFQAYGVGAMRTMLDNAARLQMTTDVTLQQMVTQGKYFIPNAVKMGVSPDVITMYEAIMAQNGFMSGRGGTSLNNLILNSMAVTPTAHLSKAKAAALRDMDLRMPDGSFRFLSKDGSVQLVQMVDYLRELRDRFKEANPRVGQSRWMTDVGAIWGKEAQRLISVLADKATQAQVARNAAAYSKIPGVQGQWDKYRHDLFYQWNTFTTNLRNLAMALWIPSVPKITKVLASINDALGNFVNFLVAHPNAASMLAELTVGLTSVFGAFALYGTLRLAVTALGIGQTATSIVGLAGAVNTFMIGAYVNMSIAIPAALNSLRAAILSFAIVNTAGVAASISAGLNSIRVAIFSLALPLAEFSATMLALPVAIIAAAAAAGYFLSKMDDYSGSQQHFGPRANQQPSFGKPHGPARTRRQDGSLSHPVHFGGPAAVHISQVILPAGTHPRDAGKVLGDFLGGIIEDPRLILGRSGSIRTSQFMPVNPIATG